MLVFSDSQAAIAAITKAGPKGLRRTKEFREAVNLIAKKCGNDESAVSLGCVKSHICYEHDMCS